MSTQRKRLPAAVPLRHVSAIADGSPIRTREVPCLPASARIIRPLAKKHLSVACIAGVHHDLRLFEEVSLISGSATCALRRPMKIATLVAESYQEFCSEMTSNAPVDVLHLMGHGQADAVHFSSTHKVSVSRLVKILRYREEKEVPISLLFLNTCHSASMAHDLSRYVSFVVAAHGTISDAAAIAVSKSFYQSLVDSEPQFDMIAAFESASSKARMMTNAGYACHIELHVR